MSSAVPIVLSPRFLDRYWRKVDRRSDDACWPWLASTTGVGYGQIYSGLGPGLMWLAHRVAYTIEYGPIPAGLQLDHLCSNRACVNPAHLEAVTQQENLRRGNARLTPDQVAEIRIASRAVSNRKLAAHYGVHHATIWRIRAGVGWKPAPPVQGVLKAAA